MSYAVKRLLAHIEKGETQDSFGFSAMGTLCGALVSTSLRIAGDRTGLSDPEFYPVCGRCRMVQRQREAKAAKEAAK